MPAIIDEIKAAELLLQSRKQVKSLADSLCTSLVSKIQGLGQAICAANLVGLYDAVTASSLDDRFKETLNKALAELAVAGGTQLATKTQMAPQKIDTSIATSPLQTGSCLRHRACGSQQLWAPPG